MLTVLVLLAFVALVLVAWRLASRSQRVRVTTCCSARPWPPDDLTGDR